MTTDVSTHTLSVPGAELYYERRGAGPLIALVGDPMDATAFAPLADELASNHTVVTVDPRGINRSTVEDRDQDSTLDLRSNDLARILETVDAGPATVFGSSGGAVTALALTQARPDLVHTVIAHEAPLDELLDDPAAVHAETDDVVETYLAGDVIGGWAKFFAQANIDLPPEMLDMMFGGDRDAQVMADEHFWFAHSMRPTTHWKPDTDRLAAVPTRIVIGIGEASVGQACDHTSRALGSRIGVDPITFVGDHTGFVDEPATFAAQLRDALAP